MPDPRSKTAQAAAALPNPELRLGRWAVRSDQLLVALALGATLTVLFNGWTLDAEVDVLANRLVRGPFSTALLTSDYTAGAGIPSGFWRPLVGLLYWILWRVGLGTPLAFYAANIALHVAVTLGVWHLARRLGAGERTALIGAALFAVHPVHADVTAGVVGLKDLLAAGGVVFGLLGLLAARDADARGDAREAARQTLLGLGAFLGGVLAKENALAVLPALVALDVVRRLTGTRTRGGLLALQYAGVLAVVALKVGLHQLFLGGTVEGVAVNPADNPLVLLPAASRSWHALGFVPFYLKLLLWPATLSADYSYDALPLGTLHALAPWGLAILLACAAASLAALAFKERFLAAALVLLGVSYLPVSNLVITLGTNAAERFLYVPSIGACFVAGWLLTRPRVPWKAAAIVTAVLVTALLARSVVRNADGRDKYRLWSAASVAVPNDIKVAINLSGHLAARKDYDRALAVVDRALAYRDPSPVTRSILEDNRAALLARRGAVLTEMGRLDEALPVLADAVQRAPDDPDVRIHYARLLNRRGAHAEALAQLDAAERNEPSSTQRDRIEAERKAALAP